MTTTHPVTLSPRVVERLDEIHKYIRDMEDERQGYGDKPMIDVHVTRRSLLDVYKYMLEAEEVWIDGGTGFSFGGVTNGNIFGRFTFGMIARVGKPFVFGNKPTQVAPDRWMVDGLDFDSQETAQKYADAMEPRFEYGPIEWTFHS
jgi:hypothetical protein